MPFNGKTGVRLAILLLAVASFVGGMYAEAVASRARMGAVTADVTNLKKAVETLQGDYATKADIARIEKRLDSLGAKMDRVLTRRR